MTQRPLSQNLAIVVSRLLISALLAFLLTAFLARTLGPAGNGIYALAILVPTLAAALGGFGLGSAAVYLLGKGEYSLKELLAKHVAIGAGSSVLIIVIGLYFIENFHTTWLPNVSKPILILALWLTPVLLLYGNTVSVFHGLQDYRTHGILTLLPLVITLSLCVCGLPFVSDKLMWAVVFWGAGYLVSLAYLIYLLRTELKHAWVNFRSTSSLISDTFLFGISSYVGNLVTLLNYRLNFYLIGYFAGASAVGIYAVTVPITEVIWLLATAAANVIFPLVASRTSDPSTNINSTPLVCRTVFIASAIIGLAIALVARILILTVFGPDFDQAIFALYILLPGVVLFTVTKMLSNDIAGRGRPVINLYLTCFALLLNIILNYTLLPKFGLNGAALAASLTYSFYTILIGITYSKIAKVRIRDCFIPHREDFYFYRLIFLKFYKKL